MKMKYLHSALAGSLLLGALTVYGDNVFTEDFNAYSDGVLPTGSAGGGFKWAPPGGSSTIDNGTNIFSRIVTDSSNLFGEGTSNKYLRIADTSTTNTASTDNFNLSINDKVMGSVGTIAFDFYDPSGDGAQGKGWLLRLATNPGNSATAFGLYLMNGQLQVATTNNVEPSGSSFATYSLDTLHSLVIFFNSSSSAASYGGNTLAANTMDVWLDGSIAATGLARSGGLVGDQILDNFNITRKIASPDFVGELFLDNFNAFSGAEASAIPEPSTAAAIGGLVTLTAAFGLRRRVTKS